MEGGNMTTENPFAAPLAKVVDGQNSEIFNNNHLRLMKRHIAVLIFYALLGAGIMSLMKSDKRVFLLIMFGLPVLIHSVLAYGSYKKNEISRQISVVVFVILAIGLMPIGTFVFIFIFLPATQ
jgi:phosphatidylserine synthase